MNTASEETVRIISFTESELQTVFEAIDLFAVSSALLPASEREELKADGLLLGRDLFSFIAAKLAS